eukprot:5998553-Pyramimonas_sp.AAC.1
MGHGQIPDLPRGLGGSGAQGRSGRNRFNHGIKVDCPTVGDVLDSNETADMWRIAASIPIAGW